RDDCKLGIHGRDTCFNASLGCFDLGQQHAEQGTKVADILFLQQAQSLPHACLSVLTARPPVCPAEKKRRVRCPLGHPVLARQMKKRFGVRLGVSRIAADNRKNGSPEMREGDSWMMSRLLRKAQSVLNDGL